MTNIATITARPAEGDELVFLPLGGSNEIGMNFNLYGYGPPHARKWIVVDLGVTFGDVTTPGVEIIMPDPTYIEEYADDIIGIVLTHAHEDHIGAVGRLLAPPARAALRHSLHSLPAARETARGGDIGRGVADRGAAFREADPRPVRA